MPHTTVSILQHSIDNTTGIGTGTIINAVAVSPPHAGNRCLLFRVLGLLAVDVSRIPLFNSPTHVLLYAGERTQLLIVTRYLVHVKNVPGTIIGCLVNFCSAVYIHIGGRYCLLPL